MKQYYEKSNDVKQECEICGKLFNYKDIIFTQTIDGNIAVCNKCFTRIKRNSENKKNEYI